MNRPIALYLAVVALASLAVPATPESHFLAAGWRPSIDAVAADARAMLGWPAGSALPPPAAGERDEAASSTATVPVPAFEHLDLIESPDDANHAVSYVI